MWEVLEVLEVLWAAPPLEVPHEVWAKDPHHSLEDQELSLGVWETARVHLPRELSLDLLQG